MKIGIIAAVDLINNQPIGGIIGFLENIIPFLDGDIYIMGYTNDKMSVSKTINYKNVKITNLFYYDYKISQFPLRIIAVLQYFLNRKLIANHGFDIIYFHSAEFIIPFIFNRNTKSVFVLHLHGAGNPIEVSRFHLARNKIFSRIWKGIEKLSFLRSDKIITIDNDCEQLLRNYNLYNKAFPLRNPINRKIFFFDDNKRTMLRNKLNIKPDDMVLLFVGRIEKFKHLDLFIESIKILKEKNNYKWYGIILGSGSEVNRINELITINHLEENIIRISDMLNSELSNLYCAADIFLLPSINEGFPMVLLEAISCGLASIAFDVGGISEIIHNGLNGYSINKSNHNSNEIVNYISRILNGKNDIDRLKISNSINNYSSEIIGAKLNNLFNDLCSLKKD